MKEKFITKENIFRLVNEFYAKVKKHEGLFPIFNNAIKDDWEEHIIKIADFWEGIMLHSGSYNGNPPKTHLNLPKFDLGLFHEWLRLFWETADDIFDQQISLQFKERSHIIAGNLKRMLELKK